MYVLYKARRADLDEVRLRDNGIKRRGGGKIILPVQRLSDPLLCRVSIFLKATEAQMPPFFSKTCRFLPVHTASHSTSLPTSCSRFNLSSSIPSQTSKSLILNPYSSLNLVVHPRRFFKLSLFPLIPGSQRVLFRRGVMGVQGGWQQGWDR